MSETIIKRYLGLTFLWMFGHSFFFATYQVFLVERGMSYMQMNVINTFFMISCFVLQIPTGAFADVFGRKKSFVLGCSILAASFTIYFLSSSFWLFVLAEVFGAAGISFVTGSMQAWAVDALEHHEYGGEMRTVYQRKAQFEQFGIISGSLIGAFIGNYDLAYPWIAAGVSMAIVGLFGLKLMDESHVKKERVSFSFAPIRDTVRTSLNYGFGHRGILYLMVFIAICSFSFQAMNMYWPLVFRQVYGLDVKYLGIIFAFIALSTSFGSRAAHRFYLMVGKEKEALISSQAITAVGMILAAMASGLAPTLAWFFLHEFGRGIIDPLKDDYLNRRVSSSLRATMLSFGSMMATGGASLGLLFSGMIAQRFSIVNSWLVSGIILIISVAVFSKLKNGEE